MLTSETSPEGPPQAGAAIYPWMAEAWRHLGVTERTGMDSDPQIAQWAAEAGVVGFRDDIDPWCTLFIRSAFYHTLPDEPLPPHPKWSLGWLRFGIECTPQLGCVLVYYRGDRAKDVGHLQLYLSEDGDDFIGLGANQTDPEGKTTGTVNVKRMPKARLLGSRWPKTWPLPH